MLKVKKIWEFLQLSRHINHLWLVWLSNVMSTVKTVYKILNSAASFSCMLHLILCLSLELHFITDSNSAWSGAAYIFVVQWFSHTHITVFGQMIWLMPYLLYTLQSCMKGYTGSASPINLSQTICLWFCCDFFFFLN